LLTTIPGIAAYSLSCSWQRSERSNAHLKKLCAWAGLVPSTYSSGGRTRHGSLTKQGSPWVRWILTQAVPHAIRGSSQLLALYQRVARRGGKNAAKMAVARQLWIIIHRMLVHLQPFGGRDQRQLSPLMS
jgi:transposase